MENRNPAAAAMLSIDKENGENVTTWALPEGAIARLGRGKGGDMAFSPDGQYFAVGTSIGLWLYELSTLSPIALWDTERGMTGHVGFSPDSQRIVTRTFSETVKIWDVQTGVCVTQIEKPDKRKISDPVFSQDGQHIVTISDERDSRIYIWCSHTGKKIRETEIQPPYQVYPICFSPDLSLLAGKNRDKDNVGRNIKDGDSITIWQIETGEQIANITGYSDPVQRFCFSPCGRFLAAGNRHGTIHVWNVESGQLERTYTDYEESHMYPYFLPEGELITAAVSERSVEIWRVEKSEKLDEFEHRWSSGTVHFSDSGTQLAFAGESEIKIWTQGHNAESHTLSTLHGHIPTMDTLAFSVDEKTLAAGLWRDNVLLWDIAGRRSFRPHGEKLPATSHVVYCSDNGKIISLNQYGDNLEISEVGKSESVVELPSLEAGLGRAKAFSPTGHRIASVDKNDNIHIWECTSTLDDMTESEVWKKHTTVINDAEFIYGLRFSPTGLAFSPDGKRLASMSRSRDWKAGLWDVDSGEQIAELPLTPAPRRRSYRESDTGIAFSPDGNIVAGGLWHEIVLWDAADGKTLMTIPQSEENQRSVTLCFSPCSQYLAAGAWWNGQKKTAICLWEVATGKNIATFKGHTTDVQCFAFSQDNTLLVSGGHDGAIYLWDLKPYL
ncbi:WD40 repeat domain-containing protein [Candidatus Poribacteria bacterium]|nr:WD40 repeat domain-containing protein [Candidatus Poribacteria bacterium]